MEYITETVTAGEAVFEFFRFGEGKKPLIILPGLSIKSILMYKAAVAIALDTFGEDYEVFVFDRRKNFPDVYPVEEMAKDYIAAFEKLGFDEVSLYGISQGGMIALSIAVQSPGFVRAMVLGSTCARFKTGPVKMLAEWNRLAMERKEDELINSFMNKVYSKAFVDAYRDAIVASSSGITEEEYERFVISTDAPTKYDVYDKLSVIKCPVLVLGGSDDQVLEPESSIEIAEKLNCELKIFEGASHAVYDEEPEFKTAAKAFLQKTLA